MNQTEFWIDMGGTFTDCFMLSSAGELHSYKILSSGETKVRVNSVPDSCSIQSDALVGLVDGFWRGYLCRIADHMGREVSLQRVSHFDGTGGIVRFDNQLPSIPVDGSFTLVSEEDVPIFAIRWGLQLPLAEPIPSVLMKLGTTRGTNALLTRSGARTAFVTTSGFGDLLRIGHQNRPRLFELNIVKAEPLFEKVLEIEERMDANGIPLLSPQPQTIREQLGHLKRNGIESLAICFIHSTINPAHERMVAELAETIGFRDISISSELTTSIGMVARGDTTVLNAYLNPILNDYLTALETELGPDNLKLMTSAGGLVAPSRFTGKESLLSGPAGGVIAYAKIASEAGFPKAIGFDMGGTSTDVSRFDGRFEREFETIKDGVRVVTPSLAIETVASGGGSLCTFDGVQLKVGPDSAGAKPGPACYGSGGPLTLTDINVYLGKIPPELFPFPLAVNSIEEHLVSIAEQIEQQFPDRQYSSQELAEGFLEIANLNMAQAIRKISVSQGYDPSDYVLVTFGGAAPQHACEIARLLEMNTILIHPYAGILSAYGIGVADVRKSQERSFRKTYTPDRFSEMETLFQQMEQELILEVQAEGIPSDQILPGVCTLEMRVEGTNASLQIETANHHSIEQAFAQQHQQQFGYSSEGKSLEVTTLRVEVVGKMPEHPLQRTVPQQHSTSNRRTVPVWFCGTQHSTTLYERAHLSSGESLIGPAIISDATSTILIDPGCSAIVTNRNEILIRIDSEIEKRGEYESTIDLKADPVRLEIFHNLFASIAEQMGESLRRTALSTNVKERLDYSCALFTSTGDLVANAPHIPVHLGAMSETVKSIANQFQETNPGDVFITNDPFAGGSHLPDITIVTPVHKPDTKEVQFWTASRAHHAEIGGIVPGSMPPFSKCLAEEGVLIRPFQLIAAGTYRELELRAILSSGSFPSRSVNDNLADITAQVAANEKGARELLALANQYSFPVIHAYMKHIQHAASEKMRQSLLKFDAGRYSHTDWLDNGSPIAVSIDIHQEKAIVDFAETGSVLENNLNANRAIVTAAVMYVFRCLIDEEIPLNSGILDPIQIEIPVSLLNPPQGETPERCAAMVGGNVETSQRVVDVMLGALQLAAASQGTMNNLTFGNDRFGYYETICGGCGATSASDGADAVHTHMTNTRLTDVEILEHRYPVRVRTFAIRKGTGGTGKHSGGNGVIREMEFLEKLQVSLISERRACYAPFGLQGGCSGAKGVNLLIKSGSSEEERLGGKVSLTVNVGDRLVIKTPGGGGFGTHDD